MGVRRGMWIRVDGKENIAIAAKVGDETVEVHYVDDEGNTFLVEPNVPMAACTQASLSDIPLSRRPSDEIAQKFGYQ